MLDVANVARIILPGAIPEISYLAVDSFVHGLTAVDVFCEGIVTHFLLFGRSYSPILIIVDVVSATLVGYYAINLHRRKADDVTSIGCLIGTLFVFYYIMYIVSGSVVGLRPD